MAALPPRTEVEKREIALQTALNYFINSKQYEINAADFENVLDLAQRFYDFMYKFVPPTPPINLTSQPNTSTWTAGPTTTYNSYITHQALAPSDAMLKEILDKLDASPTTVNITLDSRMNISDLAKEIDRKLSENTRKGGVSSSTYSPHDHRFDIWYKELSDWAKQVPPDQAYRQFSLWLKDEGYKAMTSNEFLSHWQNRTIPEAPFDEFVATLTFLSKKWKPEIARERYLLWCTQTKHDPMGALAFNQKWKVYQTNFR